MQLTSTAFADGEPIPKLYTGDGEDLSPPLAWSDPPSAARSFVLTCQDPDAPGGTWYHWGMFDIPPETRSVAEGHDPRSTSPRQAHNDFRRYGYAGPSPPPGRGRHRYVFTLYAVNVEQLGLPEGVRCGEVERAARIHELGKAQLTGTYARK